MIELWEKYYPLALEYADVIDIALNVEPADPLDMAINYWWPQ